MFLRLRRYLTEDKPVGGYAALKSIIDLHDDLFLYLEEQDDHIKDGHEIYYLDEESCQDLADKLISKIIATILQDDHLGFDTLFNALLEERDYDAVMAWLASWKKQYDETMAFTALPLSDLDDHPF